MTAKKNRTGRPTLYSPDLVDKILSRLSTGESLRKVCRDDDMPNAMTIYRWLRQYPLFCEQYERARVDSADAYAESITDIADRTLDGEYDSNAARVAIDAYKWTAARLKPKKYGDKTYIDQQVTEKKEILLVLPGGELVQRLSGSVTIENDRSGTDCKSLINKGKPAI